MRTKTIVSWNVNGIRAACRKGFVDRVREMNPDVLFLQEVRAFEDQIPEEARELKGYYSYFFPAQRPGYSGVAAYFKEPPSSVQSGLGIEKFDVEGRFHAFEWNGLVLMNGYFPNGSGKNRDHSRVPYKLDFYRAVQELAENARETKPVAVFGDWNTAFAEIDLARPKTNHKTSGFLPIEREEMSRWFDAGWRDPFRERHVGEEGHYTWWSQRAGARQRNVGWRIDYSLVSESLCDHTVDADILPDVTGSDHCPIRLALDIE